MTRSKAIKIILREIQKTSKDTIIWCTYDFEAIRLERVKRMIEKKSGEFLGAFDSSDYIRSKVTLEDILSIAQDSKMDLSQRVTNFSNSSEIPTYRDIIRQMRLELFNYKHIENYPEIFADSYAIYEEFRKEHEKEINGRISELLDFYKYFDI